MTPRQIRLLKISIAVMTALLIIGVVALIYGMAKQASRIAKEGGSSLRAPGEPFSSILDLGAGEIQSVGVNARNIVVHWRSETKDLIIIIDPQNGRETGRIQVPRPPGPRR